jgi:uncharacterized protein YhfF
MDALYGFRPAGPKLFSTIDPLSIYVPADRLPEAAEILAAAGQGEERAARIGLMRWDHAFLFESGALPLGSIDHLTDVSRLAYLGEGDEGAGPYQLFRADAESEPDPLPAEASWIPAVKAFARDPGLYAAYRALVLGGWEAPVPLYEVFGFCGERKCATELGKLVMAGEKTGTSSLAWAYEAEGEAPPRPGAVSIVVDGRGKALCAIRTESALAMPFGDVGDEHARAEGEGDKSLEYWRRVHEEFFARECAGIGREFSYSAPVVCERFSIIHRF